MYLLIQHSFRKNDLVFSIYQWILVAVSYQLLYHSTIMQYLSYVRIKLCVSLWIFCSWKGRNLIEQSSVYISWLASRWIFYEDVRLYKSIQEGIENSSQRIQFLHNQKIRVAHFHHRIMEYNQKTLFNLSKSLYGIKFWSFDC